MVWPEHSRKFEEEVERRLVLHAGALNRKFELVLTPSPRLTSPDFMYVARWKNRTETLPHHKHLAEECFYRGETAALTMCGGVVSKKYFSSRKLKLS